MKGLKNSIKFCYRYRDYANYKKYNEVVFPNPNNRPIEELNQFIKEHLFEDKLFYTVEWELPDLHFDDLDPDLDHFVHEFDSVEETNDAITSAITIDQFLLIILKARNHWIL